MSMSRVTQFVEVDEHGDELESVWAVVETGDEVIELID